MKSRVMLDENWKVDWSKAQVGDIVLKSGSIIKPGDYVSSMKSDILVIVGSSSMCIALNELGGNSNTWQQAVDKAKDYTINGFGGFQLAPKNDLYQIAVNKGVVNSTLSKIGNSGFSSSYSYWTGTSYNSTMAYLVAFDSTNDVFTREKTANCYRCWPCVYFNDLRKI